MKEVFDNAEVSWLDNIGVNDIEEYLLKSKTISENSVFEHKITFGVDKKGSKRIKISLTLKGYTSPYVVMYLDEFGLVSYYGIREDISTEENLENLKIWHSIVKRANEGVQIDGKTYDDAFIEYYRNQNKENIQPEIDKLEKRLAELKNKKIRADFNFYRLVEDNAEMGE